MTHWYLLVDPRQHFFARAASSDPVAVYGPDPCSSVESAYGTSRYCATWTAKAITWYHMHGINMRKLLIWTILWQILRFFIGDETFDTAVERTFYVPLVVLAYKVCPGHLEATIFATLIATSNIGALKYLENSSSSARLNHDFHVLNMLKHRSDPTKLLRAGIAKRWRIFDMPCRWMFNM